MSHDIAESHKFNGELSPIELTTLASNRPRPTQEEALSEKDSLAGMEPWKVVVICVFYVFLLGSLASWSV